MIYYFILKSHKELIKRLILAILPKCNIYTHAELLFQCKYAHESQETTFHAIGYLYVIGYQTCCRNKHLFTHPLNQKKRTKKKKSIL